MKQYYKWFLLSAMVMIGLPFAAVAFASAEAGMAICFLLFFVLDPIYSVFIGYVAGSGKKYIWQLPVATEILFLLGSWFFFSMGESLFIIFACIYLVMSLGAMVVARMLNRNKHKED